MNPEIVGVLAVFGLFFAGIVSLLIWFVWRRYRVIAVRLPVGGDLQAFHFKLTESIRSLGYRETTEAGPLRLFRAPAWQQWMVGLQDISLQPAGTDAVLMTGPSFNVSLIGRGYAGAVKQPYTGRQPVWPLCRGFMRLMGLGVGAFGAIFAGFFLLGVR